MKTKIILYPVTLMLMLWIPVLRYYASTPWINACVLDYVDNLEESNYKWYMYNINWIKHIEAGNSEMNDSLEEYKVWSSNWCLMVSDNLFSDMNNTFYCTVSYLIKNAPISEKLKEPLWILKDE
jgi:hypothetical protein